MLHTPDFPLHSKPAQPPGFDALAQAQLIVSQDDGLLPGSRVALEQCLVTVLIAHAAPNLLRGVGNTPLWRDTLSVLLARGRAQVRVHSAKTDWSKRTDFQYTDTTTTAEAVDVEGKNEC